LFEQTWFLGGRNRLRWSRLVQNGNVTFLNDVGDGSINENGSTVVVVVGVEYDVFVVE
jgi:hypothetical protein